MLSAELSLQSLTQALHPSHVKHSMATRSHLHQDLSDSRRSHTFPKASLIVIISQGLGASGCARCCGAVCDVGLRILTAIWCCKAIPRSHLRQWKSQLLQLLTQIPIQLIKLSRCVSNNSCSNTSVLICAMPLPGIERLRLLTHIQQRASPNDMRRYPPLDGPTWVLDPKLSACEA